jgi:hypothetical protein
LKNGQLSVTLVPAAAEGRVFAGLLRGAVVMGDKLAPDIFQMNQVAHLTARRGGVRLVAVRPSARGGEKQRSRNRWLK